MAQTRIKRFFYSVHPFPFNFMYNIEGNKITNKTAIVPPKKENATIALGKNIATRVTGIIVAIKIVYLNILNI